METWPQSLVGALSICLNCQFPIAIYWGPEKLLFYNEAWRPIVGNKHPASFGKPAREVWPEIWDVIGPLFKSVDETGVGTFSANQLLLMHRFGYTEECYFDFTFSPIKETSGNVGGIFNAVLETTFRSLSERRAKTLSDLAAKAPSVLTPQEVSQLATTVLDENPADVPFSLIYLAADSSSGAGKLELVASSGIEPSEVATLAGALEGGPIAQVARSGQPETLDDFDRRFGSITGKAWPETIKTAYVLPLVRKSQHAPIVMGALVLGVSPRRAMDQEYKNFFEQFALHLTTSILTALSYQEERRRAEALAELDRAKTAFFSNVSHEFRTPLTLMLGPLEENLAVSASLPVEVRDREVLAHRNALRLLKLVNSLLDFSRIEAGRAKATYRPTDLAHLTTDLAGVFRSTIEKAGLKYIVDISPIDEPVYVDSEMWEKIVLNLLSNAFKFTLQGSIEVSLRREGPKVEFRIKDSGTGISESELPRIFERFHRVEGSKGRSYEGSGIGLALIQELARLHGGSVRVESKLGQGSTFVVEIPLGKAHLPQDRVQESDAPAPVGTLGNAFVEEALRWLPDAVSEESGLDRSTRHSTVGSPFREGLEARQFRILVADDNADMRSYVQGLLSKTWTVEAVADGEAALSAARANPPDLILSDVMMPKMDGFQLLKALRADSLTRSVPVILLSARAGEEATIEGLQAGADDYLPKPFSAKELMARVQTHLQIGRLKAESERERAKLSAIFAQAPVGISMTEGPDHTFRIVNPVASSSLFGGDRGFAGKTVREAIPEAIEQGFVALLDRVYQTGEPFIGNEMPIELVQPDGTTKRFFLNFIYQPYRDSTGAVAGIVTVSTDVTEQVEARRKVEKLASERQSAIDSRDEFLSIASHELKTPITSIKLQLQMTKRRIRPELDQAPSPDKLAAFVNTSLKQADRLTVLVEDLLDVSRIQAGKLIFSFEELSVGSFIQDVVDRFCEQLEGPECPIHVKEAPDVAVRWDRSRIEQVIVNLLSNAIKYAPGSPVHLHAEVKDERVAISFQDFGPGIPQERHERIFERFERATSSRNISGLGLGLFIVRRIVEGHHGTIRVESEENKGTKFIVELPLFPPPARTEAVGSRNQE